MGPCEGCGLEYEDFRTGLTFKKVRARWKHKRRHTVLGLWRQVKRSMFREHREMCEYGRSLIP